MGNSTKSVGVENDKVNNIEVNPPKKGKKKKKKSFRNLMKEIKKGSSVEEKKKDMSYIKSNLGGGEFQKKYKGWLQ